MTLPLGFTGPISGIVLGLVFGFALENAGFGSACKLTSQLRFKDWAVFKVMFTAIIVSSGGLYLLQGLGMLNVTNDLFVPSVFIWGSSIGGVLIGVGMAVGGYCPGTSVAALFSGKIDGLLFLLGIGLGTVAFSLVPGIQTWAWQQIGADSLTLPQLLHLPAWVVWCALLAVLVIVGYLTRGSNRAAASDATVGSLGAAQRS